MRNYLWTMLFGFLFLSPSARAHFFVEPGVGVEFGQVKQQLVFPSLPTISSSFYEGGLTYGISGGYRYNRFFVGAELAQSYGSSVTDFAAFMGYNIKIRLRLWGSYLISTKDEVSKGTGYKVGLGYAIFKLFSINAEYVSRTFNKYTGPFAVTGQSFSGSINSLRLTVSFPSPRQPF